MSDLLELADQMWRGETTVETHPPVGGGVGELSEVAKDVALWYGFSNVIAVRSDVHLLLIDAGDIVGGQSMHEAVRAWEPELPLSFVVYTHGHIDHVFGVQAFDKEAEAKKQPRPIVYSHARVRDRFDRYRRTAGYNALINERQFGLYGMTWPTDYRYPDVTYVSDLVLETDERIELHTARGETDDHTWVWFPGRKLLCTGDLFIWACPNAGNPQKAQRYVADWAVALNRMAALGAEILLPGHGLPIMGGDRVFQALTDTAAFLEALEDQTLALMNAGARLNDIIHSVQPPPDLAGRPFLQPVYDEPEFILHNIWRQYGGWWDGDPSTLKPAPDGLLGGEIARLIGTQKLASRIRQLIYDGDDESLRLAAHLVEFLIHADAAAHPLRAEVYSARHQAATSTMTRGIFRWAEEDSRRRRGRGRR